MSDQPDKNLEQSLHRELRKLPNLRAPSNLIARVQAAIAAQELPWWLKSWFGWPRPVQMATAVLGGMLVLFVALLLGFDWPSLIGASHWAGDARATLGALASAFTTLFGALAEAAGVSLSALFGIVVAAAVFLYLGCIALGTLFYRVAMNPRHRK